MSLQINKTL